MPSEDSLTTTRLESDDRASYKWRNKIPNNCGAEHFAQWSIDELTYTLDEAAEFCQLVKKPLGAPRLTRPFILRSLVGLRKNGDAKKRAAASMQDGQTLP